MHKHTHERIAEIIAQKLKRPDLSNALKNGSLLPDEWKDFPHHTANIKKVVNRVIRARKLFLRGQEIQAAAEFGVALHYIADAHVLISGSDDYHEGYEREINKLSKSLSSYAIEEKELEGKEETINYIKSTLGDLNHERMRELPTFFKLKTPGINKLNPEDALRRSLEISLSVGKSVLGPKNSQRLQEKLEQLKKNMRIELKDAEKKFARQLIELCEEYREFKRKPKKGIRKLFSWSEDQRYKARIRKMVQYYEERRHLLKLRKSYYSKAGGISRPYIGWYEFQIPEINIDEIERELITIEVARHLKVDRSSIYHYICDDDVSIIDAWERSKIPSYKINDKMLIKRSHLHIFKSILRKPISEVAEEEVPSEISKKFVEVEEDRELSELSREGVKVERWKYILMGYIVGIFTIVCLFFPCFLCLVTTVNTGVSIATPTEMIKHTTTPSRKLSPLPIATLTISPTATLAYTLTSTPIPPTFTPASAQPTPTPTQTPLAIPPNCPNPSAHLTYPTVDAVLKGTVQIYGSANINNFWYYKLEFRYENFEDEWHVIGELHETPVIAGLLGEWDVSSLPEGVYLFRLTVVDKTGNYPTPCKVRVIIRH
jgi:uncharacterized membrane-anchored protein YhcB (DUF1043 family)